MKQASARSGFVLILVSGICLLLCGLILAFVARMRSEVAENQVLLRTTQARLMMAAACAYILESGRIGWETDTYNPTTGAAIGAARHEEAFGWVDVRDGSLGPKRLITDSSAGFAAGSLANPGVFPRIGGKALRCPMAVRNLTPFALISNTAVNAIDPANGALPLLLRPDPQPVAMDASTYTVDQAKFRLGDPALLPATTGLSWFRICRDGPATFTITCGGGATMGFKDWADVPVADRDRYFGGDLPAGEDLFNSQLAQEVRLWYRVEWNAAIGHASPNQSGFNAAVDNYETGAYAAARYTKLEFSTPMLVSSINAAGTIQWIQRLRTPPANW